MAKYSILIPNNFKHHSPKMRNTSRIIIETRHTIHGLILVPFFSRLMVIGIFPKGSIIAMRNTNAGSTCQMSKLLKKSANIVRMEL